MNILHCPKCGGDLIVNKRITISFTKKMILTDKGWDEISDRMADEYSHDPVQTLGSACCNSCGKEWRRPLYEIGVNNDDDSVSLIELNRAEVKMERPDRKEYFLEKGIKIIT